MTRKEWKDMHRTLHEEGLFDVSDIKGFATVAMVFTLHVTAVWQSIHLYPSHLGLWVLGLLAGVLAFLWFVVLHECGHNTLFSRKRVNSLVGHVASAACLIPYIPWRNIHREHHRWVGVIDKDPTQTHLLKLRRFGPARNAVLRFIWRWWLPFPFALFIFEVFWAYPVHRWRAGDRSNAFKGAGSIAFIVAVHTLLITGLGFVIWAYLILPMLLAFYFIIENFNLPQHSELFPHLSETHPEPIPPAEQDTITRSTHLPDWLSVVLALNFNRHTEHHLFAAAPWYSLNRIRKVMRAAGYQHPHEVPFARFMIRLRKKDPVKVFRDALPSEGV